MRGFARLAGPRRHRDACTLFAAGDASPCRGARGGPRSAATRSGATGNRRRRSRKGAGAQADGDSARTGGRGLATHRATLRDVSVGAHDAVSREMSVCMCVCIQARTSRAVACFQQQQSPLRGCCAARRLKLKRAHPGCVAPAACPSARSLPHGRAYSNGPPLAPHPRTGPAGMTRCRPAAPPAPLPSTPSPWS